MGLMVHSLDEIPDNISREYYIYLLDYGWSGSLSHTVMENFGKISNEASQSNSIFITGTVGSHVNSEIMSYHHINGEDAEDIYPAILITKDNPHTFKAIESGDIADLTSKIIIVPLNKCCNSNQDVISMITKIFSDIKEKKDLSDFKVYKEMNRSIGRKILDGVLLEPNFAGVGFNFKTFFGK